MYGVVFYFENRYLKYMESMRDEFGLMHYGLGDWCHSQRSQSEIQDQLKYTDTITCKHLCDIAAIMFAAIGDDESSAYARNLSDDIKKLTRKDNSFRVFIFLLSALLSAESENFTYFKDRCFFVSFYRSF